MNYSHYLKTLLNNPDTRASICSEIINAIREDKELVDAINIFMRPIHIGCEIPQLLYGEELQAIYDERNPHERSKMPITLGTREFLLTKPEFKFVDDEEVWSSHSLVGAHRIAKMVIASNEIKIITSSNETIS